MPARRAVTVAKLRLRMQEANDQSRDEDWESNILIILLKMGRFGQHDSNGRVFDSRWALRPKASIAQWQSVRLQYQNYGVGVKLLIWV